MALCTIRVVVRKEIGTVLTIIVDHSRHPNSLFSVMLFETEDARRTNYVPFVQVSEHNNSCAHKYCLKRSLTDGIPERIFFF